MKTRRELLNQLVKSVQGSDMIRIKIDHLVKK